MSALGFASSLSAPAMMRRTVVVVDMVGYSDIAKLLEENISAGSVAELNRQIQAFISRAVKELGDPEACCLMARTGDGAILLFERAGDAHSFAISVQMQARRHNQSRSEVTAKRRFRIGIATGDVSKSPGQGSPDEYAGIAIANAKRLESAARASEIVTDTETFAELPPEARSLYRGAELVRGKRKESFRAHRCILPEAASDAPLPVPKLTRRHLLAGSAVLAAASAGGTAWWANRHPSEHPLPVKRFVVLLHWPQVHGEISDIVSHALRSIEAELSRVEAVDRNFFITHDDDSSRSNVTPRFSELKSNLGTNLVLAVSGELDHGSIRLPMQLVDAESGKILRKREVVSRLDEQLKLPDTAVDTAATLLDLSDKRKPRSESGIGTDSIEAQKSFFAAEAFLDSDNDTGLDQAIEKYKNAIDIDPNFALAYARLAIAYCRVSDLRHDPGALALAQRNCDHARRLRSNLLEIHLASAQIYMQTGEDERALDEIGQALSIEPTDSRTLVWQGHIYAKLERWHEAETTFQRAIDAHPNNWYAYNELGVVLVKQGKYTEALAPFQAASNCQPHNAMVWADIGDVYLETGRLDRAADAFQKSLAFQETGLAAVNMVVVRRAQRQYAEALRFALRAVQLDGSDSVNWLELGDTYARLPGRTGDALRAFGRAAEVQQDQLRINPSDGPGYMILALCSLKLGRTQPAILYMSKADKLGAKDMESQLYKIRLLVLLDRREEALGLITECLGRGATRFQLDSLPDTDTLRHEPKYSQLVAHMG
jgi:tetratricopeptide (TPR) repeat protein